MAYILLRVPGIDAQRGSWTLASLLAAALVACAGAPSEATVAVGGAASETTDAARVEAIDVPQLLARHVDFKNARGYDAFTLAEVPSTTVLVFRSQRDMNRHFGRVSIFAEGTAREFKGKVIPEAAFTAGSYDYLIGGHDLEAASLCRFFETAARDGAPLWDEERRLRDFLVARRVLDAAPGRRCDALPGHAVLAQFDTLASEKYATYSHELLHAMFFNAPKLAEAALGFYREELSVAESTALKERLGASYDTSDDRLLANELLAYTFMAGGQARNALYEDNAALNREALARRMRARIAAAGEADRLITLPALPAHLADPPGDPEARERLGARWSIVERVGSRGALKDVAPDGTGGSFCVRALRSPSFNRQGDFKLDVDRQGSAAVPTVTLLFDRNNLLGDNGLGSMEACFDRKAHGLEGITEWRLGNEVAPTTP